MSPRARGRGGGVPGSAAHVEVLHVAALPFPTPQGTQAAIASMMRALDAHERPARLLTYAGGAPGPTPSFAHERLAHAFGDHSTRSGPSLAKVAQDLALAEELRRRRPELVVAHHVEAAAAAWMARVPRRIFVAHTLLGPELPSYLPPGARLVAPLVARAGETLDVALVRSADACLAVSPLLASRLSATSGRRVDWLPIPWPCPSPASAEERRVARRTLGIADDAEVALYAGNLDAYQGLDELFRAHDELSRRRPRLELLLATASAPDGLRLPRATRLVPLTGDEVQRRRLHAAADVVVVPREAPGGLPIKLVDALARGVPVACVPRATAGLPLDGVCALAAPHGLAEAIDRVLRSPALARELAEAGPAWVARELSDARFLDALDAAIERAGAGRSAVR